MGLNLVLRIAEPFDFASEMRATQLAARVVRTMLNVDRQIVVIRSELKYHGKCYEYGVARNYLEGEEKIVELILRGDKPSLTFNFLRNDDQLVNWLLHDGSHETLGAFGVIDPSSLPNAEKWVSFIGDLQLGPPTLA